jgi:hypothetical protein
MVGNACLGIISMSEDYGLELNWGGPPWYPKGESGPLPPLVIEMEFIAGGGYLEYEGQRFGKGLYHHYHEMMSLLWPRIEWHRWLELGLKRLCENEICVFMGPADSGKTYLSSAFVLCHWWAHADSALWLVSSTELRGSELRNWGKIKDLFNQGKEAYPWLPGKVLESKHAIVSGQIDDSGEKARLLGRGIVFVPCLSNGNYVGLGRYAGIKPPNEGEGWLGHYGDECSFMQRSLLDAYHNWTGKENFKGILNGNPTNIDDCLCVAAEPENGWSNWQDSKKTQEWKSKFFGAHVVAYDGRDTPNNDFPQEPKQRYRFLTSKKRLDAALKAEHGDEDSPIFRQQSVGKPQPGSEQFRVLTWQLCEQGKAFEDVIWEGSERVRLASMDAAYSGIGGDRCVLGRGEFGTDVNGNQILTLYPYVLVPVKISHLPGAKSPEDQIAEFCRDYCIGYDIPPGNFFYDGRATLAVSIGRLWSTEANAVDFGGPATKRPASQEDFVWDEQEGRRLKRSDEKYSKFISELWFAVRYMIVGQQLRGLQKDVAEEGCKRIWRYTAGVPARMEVETKKEMKVRTRQSPDLMDQTVTLIEGARRLGFQIQSLLDTKTPDGDSAQDYLKREVEKHRRFIKSRGLNYRA